jgi:tetraacyldisaccharide 4'-kinase
MERWLTRVWYERGSGGALLSPLAWAYGGIVGARRRAYARGWLHSVSLETPVVVVGNLTVGGTGKTPLVLWLAQRLAASGVAVGIVSRGYKRAGAAVRVVTADSDWREVGDEPLLLHERSGCPVVVGRDRVAAARSVARGHVQVIVCDDGLQHLRLARGCELVVIDGKRGFGNHRLLPAGPLREPAARLASADAVVLNGEPTPQLAAEIQQLTRSPVHVMQLEIDAASSLALPARRCALADFRGRPVHAVAGIGHPARFFRALAAHGLEPIEHPFPDHHPFAAAELAFADELPILMTEKDAVRCREFASSRMWSVPASAHFEEPAAQALLGQIRARAGLRPSG